MAPQDGNPVAANPTKTSTSTPATAPVTQTPSSASFLSFTSTTNGAGSGQTKPSSQPKGHSTEIRTGTAIGGIVGALVGGLLIGSISAFLFLRLWRRRQSRHHSEPKRRRHSEKPYGGFRSSGNALVPRENAWQSHLPQPADDNSLRLRLKTLFHQVELHVENFYTDGETSGRTESSIEGDISLFDSGHLSAPLAVTLQQTRVKAQVIKHSLMNFILTKIAPEVRLPPSFLPIEYIALPTAFDRNGSEINKAGSKEALSRWRVMTAYLRPDPSTDQAYIEQRDTAIAEAASAFSAAFAPWAVASQSEKTRRQNLVEIMRSATDTGILLFSQPSTFGYHWEATSGAGGGRTFVVTPTVVKLTDDHGVPLSKPYVMLQQKVDNV